MASLFDLADAPDDLSAIQGVDLTPDIASDPSHDLWFQLGAWTVNHRKDANGVEDVVSRKCFLLDSETYVAIADRLGSVGNVIGSLGLPGGQVTYRGSKQTYAYQPFYRYDLHIATMPGLHQDLDAALLEAIARDTGDEAAEQPAPPNEPQSTRDADRAEAVDDTDDEREISGEPIVFTVDTTAGTDLCINPDLWMFLKLEERQAAAGIWWDPERGQEVMRRHLVDNDNLLAVDIRRDYLLKYLKARQKALVVGHYRHLHYDEPPQAAIAAFVTRNVEMKGASGARAAIHSWQGKSDGMGQAPYLRRAIHLWFKIDPPPLSVDTAFVEEPDFDVSQYTLATHSGPIAPGRFAHRGSPAGTVFAGVPGDFLERTYFQQDVLVKYQSASGFTIDDDGSLHCGAYWGLSRSTRRHGNELLSTYIGDFAEAIPHHEWAHWHQFAVQPPSIAMLNSLDAEQTIPDAVNVLVDALHRMNEAFSAFATRSAGMNVDTLWTGSLDSLAGRQLKWAYPSAAGDDEFVTRATLIATLVLDAFDGTLTRTVLTSFGPKLHQKNGNSLASRNLLQRIVLVAALIGRLKPAAAEIPDLVGWAENGAGCSDAQLQSELSAINKDVRQDFSALAILYDLRNHGGLAHTPNSAGVVKAAVSLGFAAKNWRRRDYLKLINLVISSVEAIAQRLDAAGE